MKIDNCKLHDCVLVFVAKQIYSTRKIINLKLIEKLFSRYQQSHPGHGYHQNHYMPPNPYAMAPNGAPPPAGMGHHGGYGYGAGGGSSGRGDPRYSHSGEWGRGEYSQQDAFARRSAGAAQAAHNTSGNSTNSESYDRRQPPASQT